MGWAAFQMRAAEVTDWGDTNEKQCQNHAHAHKVNIDSEHKNAYNSKLERKLELNYITNFFLRLEKKK